MYSYESRPSGVIRDRYSGSKLNEAIRFDIIEHDEFAEEFTLSVDTLEYYDVRLGQNRETNIGLIGEKLEKLQSELNFYNQRVKNSEATDKELKSIHKILYSIPSLLKNNLVAIASNSIFAYKSEPNFKIKMEKLQISKGEISKLLEATYSCDKFLNQQYHFFKAMNNYKINAAVLRFKKASIELEKSFIKLFDDIKSFINQSIKDGEFTKKLQKLKVLKDEKRLLGSTNIEELAKKQKVIVKSLKVKRVHPDDQIYNYLETMIKIIERRKIELHASKTDTALKYDINEENIVQRKLYDYQKLNREFLEQDEELMAFLIGKNIDKSRLLGVFIRMVKNYSSAYEVDGEKFVKYNNREFVEVKRCL
ncbi:MAG: hypothetical protein U9R27_09065 [Campylobacterota bacterium]|nr:hypothetical protein [Campylobacterota bacterium]